MSADRSVVMPACAARCGFVQMLREQVAALTAELDAGEVDRER